MVAVKKIGKLEAEIITVGREVLTGKTLNTNSQWLSGKITALGGVVRRHITVDDRVQDIAKAVEESLNRGVDLIIVTGGLGPTFDDVTREGLAEAFKRKLRLNDSAVQMITQRYSQLRGLREEEVKLTELQRRMAEMPEGSKPVMNPVGVAPGIVHECGSTLTVAMPGVPKEVEGIFESYVEPLIRRRVGGFQLYELNLLIAGVSESIIAPMVGEAMKNYAPIYIKSHPMGASLIKLDITCGGKDVKEVGDRVLSAASFILRRILQGFNDCSGTRVVNHPFNS
jgi:molybdenum cofactor synthesis domain-containing protein